MKVTNFLRSVVVATAVCGMLLPHTAMSYAAENAQSIAAQNAVVRDVALGNGGVMRGQVVDRDGMAREGAIVTIESKGVQVAEARTNAEGLFAVAGLKGGIYAISSDSSSGVVRAWSNDSAPPAAAQGILLVPHDITVRGKGKGGHGGFLGGNGIGLGGLLVLGLAGAVVAVAIDKSSS
jgi:hypothetical protein